MSVFPNLIKSRKLSTLQRLVLCIRSYRKWRQVRAIDGAIVVLWNEVDTDAAMPLMEISDRLWSEIFNQPTP